MFFSRFGVGICCNSHILEIGDLKLMVNFFSVKYENALM